MPDLRKAGLRPRLFFAVNSSKACLKVAVKELPEPETIIIIRGGGHGPQLTTISSTTPDGRSFGLHRFYLTNMSLAADADISVGGFFTQSVNLVDADSLAAKPIPNALPMTRHKA